jgi:hypothetical protein
VAAAKITIISSEFLVIATPFPLPIRTSICNCRGNPLNAR